MNTPGAAQALERLPALDDKAARLLVAARRQGTLAERLPIELRPTNLEEGFAIQQKVGDQLGWQTAAWKCALPPAGKLIAAPIYDAVIHRGAQYSIRAGLAQSCVRVEPELACLLAHDLPPRREAYGEAEVFDALGNIHVALELLGSRYVHPETLTFPELLADGLFNAGLVIGPRVALREGATPADLPAEFTVSVTRAGHDTVSFAGRHPDRSVLAPIVWLANFLRVRGLGLHAGQAVITGSYAGVLELPIGCELHIGFGDLGTLPLTFLS